MYDHCVVDIDECAVGKGGCDQICTNTPGSYSCSCDSDFQLQPDGRTCQGETLSIHLLCLAIVKIQWHSVREKMFNFISLLMDSYNYSFKKNLLSLDQCRC